LAELSESAKANQRERLLTQVMVNLSVTSISSPPLVVRFLAILDPPSCIGSIVFDISAARSGPYSRAKFGLSIGRSLIGRWSGTPLSISSLLRFHLHVRKDLSSDCRDNDLP
jgi:hypothetical protein